MKGYLTAGKFTYRQDPPALLLMHNLMNLACLSMFKTLLSVHWSKLCCHFKFETMLYCMGETLYVCTCLKLMCETMF
jgi:hypothetical protein